MLVLPIENKLDWRHPPLVTVLLVVLNCWVYFALVGSADEATSRAYEIYSANNFIAVEASAYRTYLVAQGRNPRDLPDEDWQLEQYAAFDLGFDVYLREHPPQSRGAGAEWRMLRNQFEAARDRISWIRFGLVPAQPRLVTYFTSMYLHAGIGHLLGNMVFLFVFGFSLERSIGRFNYFALYHLTGICSGLLTVAVLGDSYRPGIGASGAVSGLMGAYIAVYRLRKVRFFYNFLFYFGEFRAPALWVFPFWVGKELYGNYFGDQGIGYWAHIGGLLSGAGLGLLLSVFTRRVDEQYLDQGAREQHHHDEKARLQALVDEFKYDQAKALCARILERQPRDLDTWSSYLGVLRSDTSDPDYHMAVLKIVSFGREVERNPQLAEFVEQNLRLYLHGKHPQPAVKNPQLLARLGVAFARTGRLEMAREVADLLLENARVTDDVRKFLTALVTRLQAQGEPDLAQRYQDRLATQQP